MTKTEFLITLKDKLKNKNVRDVDDLVYYYEDIIDGKLDKGESIESILSNYINIDELVEEIILVNKDNEDFTFKEYLKANSIIDSKYTKETNNVKDLDFNDNYNLTTKVWQRNVTITSGNTSKVELKYKNKFFLPIEVYSNKDNVEIIERGERIWISALIQISCYILINILIYLLFIKVNIFSGSTRIWASVGVTTIIQAIVSLILHYVNKNKNDLEIIIPNNKAINNIDIIERNGKLLLNNIKANNIKVRSLSGEVNLESVVANNYEFKINSSSLTLNNKDTLIKEQVNNLSVVCLSGNSKIFGLNIKDLSIKVNSGSIYLENINTYKSSFKVSSGTITTNNFKTLKETNIRVSSGSYKGENLELGNVNLNISSGSAKLFNINGKKDDYVFNTKVRSGNMKINNSKLAMYTTTVLKETPKLIFNANVRIGNIKLDFKEK